MSTLLKIVIVLLIIVISARCKKYPENNLWFKSPEKAFTNGNLKSFTVNGVDSMPMWDAIYNDPTTNNNGYCSLLKATDLILRTENLGSDGWGLDSQIGGGSWHFYSNKKYLYIYFKMDFKEYCLPPVSPKYNLFLTTEGNWKVLKLTENGTLKIQRTYNDKVYEMEFD